MKFPCARCGQDTSKETAVWLMWRGRLVRVGPTCAKHIQRESAGDAAQKEGVGEDVRARLQGIMERRRRR